jgi:hypothetical protein
VIPAVILGLGFVIFVHELGHGLRREVPEVLPGL